MCFTCPDTAVLQFALYLEQLESAYYDQGLTLFNESAFGAVGFPPKVRQRFVEMLGHELTHVALIEGLLGSDAPQPCNYSL